MVPGSRPQAAPLAAVLGGLFLSALWLTGCVTRPAPVSHETPAGRAVDKAGRPVSESNTARAVKTRHEAALMEVPGVSGVGLSQDEAGRPVIEVYVETRTPALERRLPALLEGVPVRIGETGGFEARGETQRRTHLAGLRGSPPPDLRGMTIPSRW